MIISVVVMTVRVKELEKDLRRQNHPEFADDIYLIEVRRGYEK